MTDVLEFALLPVERLREHEEVEPADVARLRASLLADGVVREPVLVARGSLIILNGHHRFAALRQLGATRIPVFLIDYEHGPIRLHRWAPGPALEKSDVVAMAARGERYPPKTTRHVLEVEVPPHPTPLADLGIAPRSDAVVRRR